MASQARQVTRLGIPSRTGNVPANQVVTLPANASVLGGAGSVSSGVGPNQQKTTTPSTGQSLTFSLSSGAMTEGFSVTGNTVYYRNPNVPSSSSIAVATISPSGTVTPTNNSVSSSVYGNVGGAKTFLGTVSYAPSVSGTNISLAYSGFKGAGTISEPIYGQVGGAKEYLGSVQYVPSVSGQNVALAYSGFSSATVTQQTKVYVPDYALGRYIPVGVTLTGTTSYNASTGKVSYSLGQSASLPVPVYLAPQSVSGSVYGLPSSIIVKVNPTISFSSGGAATVNTGAIGLSLGSAAASSSVGITMPVPGSGYATTVYSVSKGQIYTQTDTLTYQEVAVPGSAAAASVASSGVTSQNGLAGGSVVPSSGAYIPVGGSGTVGLETFGNKVLIGGKTYNLNFSPGQALQTGSASAPATSSGLALPILAYSTKTYSYTSSVTLNTGSIQSQPQQIQQPTAVSYSTLGTSSSKSLSTAHGDLTIGSSPTSKAYSIGLLETQGYTLSQAKESVFLQGVTNAALSVEQPLNSTIGQTPLFYYGTAAKGAQASQKGLFALYAGAKFSNVGNAYSVAGPLGATAAVFYDLATNPSSSPSAKAAAAAQTLAPFGVAAAEASGIAEVGPEVGTLIMTGLVVGVPVVVGIAEGHTSPKAVAYSVASGFTFLGGAGLLEEGSAPVLAPIAESVGSAGGLIGNIAKAVGPTFAYGATGVFMSEAQSVASTGRGITTVQEAEIIGGAAIFTVGGNAAVEQIFGKSPSSVAITAVSRSGYYLDKGYYLDAGSAPDGVVLTGQEASPTAAITLNRPVSLNTQVDDMGAQQVTFVPKPGESFTIANKDYQLVFSSSGTPQYAFNPASSGYDLQAAYKNIISNINYQRTGDPFYFLSDLAPRYSGVTLEGKSPIYIYSGTAQGVTDLGTPATVEFNGRQPVTMTSEGLVGKQSPVQGTVTVTLKSAFREFLNAQFGLALPTRAFTFSSVTSASLTSAIDSYSNLASPLTENRGTFTQDTYAGSAVSRIHVQNSNYVLLSGVMTSGARTIPFTDVLYDPSLGESAGSPAIASRSPSESSPASSSIPRIPSTGSSTVSSSIPMTESESFAASQLLGIEPGTDSASAPKGSASVPEFSSAASSASEGGQIQLTKPQATATANGALSRLTPAMPFQSGEVEIPAAESAALTGPPDPSVIIGPTSPPGAAAMMAQPSFAQGQSGIPGSTLAATAGRSLSGQTAITNAQAPASYLASSFGSSGSKLTSGAMASGIGGASAYGTRAANAGPFTAPAIMSLSSGFGVSAPGVVNSRKSSASLMQAAGYTSYASDVVSGQMPAIGSISRNVTGTRTSYKPQGQSISRSVTETGYRPAFDMGLTPAFGSQESFLHNQAMEYGYYQAMEYGYRPAMTYKTKTPQPSATAQRPGTTSTTPPPPSLPFANSIDIGGRNFNPGARKQTKGIVETNAFRYRPSFKYNSDITSQTFNIRGVKGSKRGQEAFGLGRPIY